MCTKCIIIFAFPFVLQSEESIDGMKRLLYRSFSWIFMGHDNEKAILAVCGIPMPNSRETRER